MPFNTFAPNPRPSPGTTVTPELALNTAQFGDGYIQSSPKGINHIRRTVVLKWDALTLTQVQTLRDFFLGQAGYIPFLYTVYGDSVQRKWTCAQWSQTDGAPHSFTATLKENFTNDT